ncbi:MAG: carbohydrate ABC transporter permease [Bacilli bacterium]|nr:carbohydrate ABC transporter permease [Bacilli bacterium]
MQKELYLNPEELKRFKIRSAIGKIFVYGFVIIMAIYILVPFLWMILSSVKQTWEITARDITFLPIDRETRKMLWPWEWEWSNYGKLINGITAFDQHGNEYQSFKPMPFHWMFLNTIVVGFFTTSGTVVTTILAAFAFSRLNFKGRDLIFAIFLATMMIPGEVFVITNYMTLSRFTGWIKSQNHLENYAALVFPFITSVFYTFFLRQTFRQIPNELYLAAKVDGTSDFKYLVKIMIPIAQATITTIIILSMIGTWNAYVWPNFVTNANYTNQLLVSNGLMVGLRGASETTGPNSVLNLQLAASTMVTVPLLIVFFTCKKYILRGVSRSGIKG